MNLIILLVVGSVGLQSSNGYTMVDTVKLYYFNQKLSIEKSIAELQPGDIDENLPLKVVIHGWLANRNHASIKPVRDAYKLQETVNLLVADWNKPALMGYPDSRSIITKVGLKFAEILSNFTTKFNIPPENIHLVGHSLGAHISSIIGKQFEGKLARVTGLDPAYPLFSPGAPDMISSSSAVFVDIIHTNAKILGIFEPKGHVDFYPNMGVASQPGCEFFDAVNAFSCSHLRAPIFYAESILLPKNFPAYRVEFSELSTGDKDYVRSRKKMDDMVYMGEGADPAARGVYFLETSSMFPYGKAK